MERRKPSPPSTLSNKFEFCCSISHTEGWAAAARDGQARPSTAATLAQEDFALRLTSAVGTLNMSSWTTDAGCAFSGHCCSVFPDAARRSWTTRLPTSLLLEGPSFVCTFCAAGGGRFSDRHIVAGRRCVLARAPTLPNQRTIIVHAHSCFPIWARLQ